MIMFEKLRTRRQIVESAGALGLLGTVAALHTARPAHAAAEAEANAAVGTWLATVTIEVPHAPAPYGALLTLNAGGTMIISNSRERLTMAGAQYGSWVTNADGTVSILGIGFQEAMEHAATALLDELQRVEGALRPLRRELASPATAR
jgi:hypothetical protein